MKNFFAVLKNLFAAALILAFSSSVFGTAAFADNNVKVMVDGEYVEFTDAQPVILNGRTLLPIRAVMEKLEKTVTWDEETQTVVVNDAEITLTLQIGNNIMNEKVVDLGTGETFEFDETLDVAPTIIDERTMLPIRAVVEGFGIAVTWDEATETVMIISSQTLC